MAFVCPYLVRTGIRRSIRVVEGSIDLFFKIGTKAIRILGPFFVLLGLGLIGFVSYAYLVDALPMLSYDPLEQGVFGGIGLFVLFNILYNYLKTVFMDAGAPPAYVEAEFADAEIDRPKPRHCMKCQRLKPPRAHHCSVCNRCTMKMDHHCPWVNNCVGHANYRHFFLFMLFLWLGCGYVILTLQLQLSFNQMMRKDRLVTSILISTSVFIAIALLGGFHLYLVCTNQTTIEFHINTRSRKEAKKNGEKWSNVYNLGCSRNLQEVFGSSRKLRWLFPYLAQPPKGDGQVFHVNMPRNI